MLQNRFAVLESQKYLGTIHSFCYKGSESWNISYKIILASDELIGYWIQNEGEVREHKEKQAAKVKRNPSGWFQVETFKQLCLALKTLFWLDKSLNQLETLFEQFYKKSQLKDR